MRAALGLVLVCGCSYTPPADVADAAVNDAADAPDAFVQVALCAPLERTSPIVGVDNISGLRDALATTTTGTIELANGTYPLNPGGALVLANPGITLRSASGDASMVILDATGTAPALAIQASNITITALTIKGANGTGMLVEPTASGDLTGVVVHDVTFVDNLGVGLDIHAAAGNNALGPYADNGTVACSRFQQTSSAPCAIGTVTILGIDGEAVRNWNIHDNRFEGLACGNRVVRTARFYGGSRDVTVASNTFLNSTHSLMMGFTAGVSVRAYPDPLPGCSASPEMRGGVVCNNAITGLDVPPIAGTPDFQGGISFRNACDTFAVHNTVVSPAGVETASSIDYSFTGTVVHLVNNLLQRAPRKISTGTADHLPSNAIYMSPSDFIDPRTDLHLTSSATVPSGESITTLGMCGFDAEGKPRNLVAPTVGAYER